MEHIDLYKKLAARMNEGVMVDAPVTNSLLKILMLLFNPDEAEIAAKAALQKCHFSGRQEPVPQVWRRH